MQKIGNIKMCKVIKMLFMAAFAFGFAWIMMFVFLCEVFEVPLNISALITAVMFAALFVIALRLDCNSRV